MKNFSKDKLALESFLQMKQVPKNRNVPKDLEGKVKKVQWFQGQWMNKNVNELNVLGYLKILFKAIF